VSEPSNYHTIGEVLNVLLEEFPDISISKIRFLESQGLITPARTPSGYRKFDRHDIERLRFILREQRDRFLPLKVIKRRLEAWEQGGAAAGAGEAPARLSGNSEQASFPAEAKMSRNELADASGISPTQIAELERYGLLEHSRTENMMEADGNNVFDEYALAVAKLAAAFTQFGVEARHLRMFRQAVDRETSLFDQVVAPLQAQHSVESAEQAEQANAELVRLSKELHGILLERYLTKRTRIRSDTQQRA